MYYEKRDGLLIIHLKIITKTSKTELSLPNNEDLPAKLKISAVPEKGKANKAIIEYLAKALKISKQQVSILKGETSPLKTLSFNGDPNQLLERLQEVAL